MILDDLSYVVDSDNTDHMLLIIGADSDNTDHI